MNVKTMRPARLRKALAITMGLGLTLIGPSFALAQTFPGAGLGAIPDNAPAAGLDTTFAVSGITAGIADLNLSFTATHTWVGDISVTLIAPGGSPSASLFVRPNFAGTGFGSSSDLGGTYVFVDPATLPAPADFWVAAATNPVAPGTYFTSSANSAAATPLNAVFAGLSPAQINGTWTLSFTDSGSGDTGSVSATQMVITQAAPITSTPTTGMTVNLPPFTVGGPATTALINFQNGNASSATVTCTTTGPDFTVSPSPQTVPAAGNADVTVSFSSAAVGPFSDTLVCTGSGGENFSFPLSGTAVAAPVVLPAVAIPTLGDGSRLLLVFGLLGFGLLLVRQRNA